MTRSSATMTTVLLSWGHVSNLPTHHTPQLAHAALPLSGAIPLAQAIFAVYFIFTLVCPYFHGAPLHCSLTVLPAQGALFGQSQVSRTPHQGHVLKPSYWNS